MASDAPFRLIVVRVPVTDWERAIRFYTDTLGIPLASKLENFGWAELDTGAAHLAIERWDGEEEFQVPGRFLGVSLAVADIYGTCERLVAEGVEFVEPPALMPWGGVLAHLKDPDGNVVTLVGMPRA
jgi:catechol 2,3-dioxygenase-like lactoylglutathione lyase family enzyme